MLALTTNSLLHMIMYSVFFFCCIWKEMSLLKSACFVPSFVRTPKNDQTSAHFMQYCPTSAYTHKSPLQSERAPGAAQQRGGGHSQLKDWSTQRVILDGSQYVASIPYRSTHDLPGCETLSREDQGEGECWADGGSEGERMVNWGNQTGGVRWGRGGKQENGQMMNAASERQP